MGSLSRMCPQVFLFVYYGLILQAAQEGSLVRNHLQGLLQTSHQWATQREVRDLERGCAGPGPPAPTLGPLRLESLHLVRGAMGCSGLLFQISRGLCGPQCLVLPLPVTSLRPLGHGAHHGAGLCQSPGPRLGYPGAVWPEQARQVESRWPLHEGAKVGG